MKKTLTRIAASVLIAMLGFVGLAETVRAGSPFSPIAVNRQCAESDAFDRIREAVAWCASGNAQQPTGSCQRVVFAGVQSPESVSNAVANITLDLSVLNYNDRVSLGVNLVDSSGRPVMGGTKEFYFLNDYLGPHFPDGWNAVSLEYSGHIYINVDGVTNTAFLWLKDSQGRTTGEVKNFRVEGGAIIFPLDYAGIDGILDYQIADDEGALQWKHWDIRADREIVAQNYDLNLSVDFENFGGKTDGSQFVTISTPTTNSVGSKVKYRHLVTDLFNGEYVFFRGQTSEGKWAIGFFVKEVGTADKWSYFYTYDNGWRGYVTYVALGMGLEYWVVPVYRPEDLIDPKEETGRGGQNGFQTPAYPPHAPQGS
jgi:hypothetical protein